jgi:hypothetical protein
MSEFHRPRTEPYGAGGSPVTSVRLTHDTRRGFEEIRETFKRRFPREKFPTLSACLEIALRRYLNEVGNDPKALREEVAEFRERYGVKT